MLPEVQIVEKLTSKFKVWYIFKAEILGKKNHWGILLSQAVFNVRFQAYFAKLIRTMTLSTLKSEPQQLLQIHLYSIYFPMQLTTFQE